MLTNSTNLKNALRGGIAIMLSIIAGHILEVKYPYWIIFSTVVVMQPSFGATLLRAKQRTLSTIVGVALGAMLAVLIGHSEIIIITLSVIFFTITVMSLPYNYAHAIFYVTMGLMLILSHGQSSTWNYVYIRLYDTIVGVIIGTGCSLLIFPNWARKQLNDNLGASINSARSLFSLVTQCLIKHDPNPTEVNRNKLVLEEQIEANRQFLDQASHEITFARVKLAPSSAIVSSVEHIASILNIFHMLSRIDLQAHQPERTIKRLQQYKEETQQAFDIIVNIIKNRSAPLSPQQTRDFLKLIKQTPELDQDASMERRFLHRNINLLRSELNHLFQASILLHRYNAQNKTPQ